MTSVWHDYLCKGAPLKLGHILEKEVLDFCKWVGSPTHMLTSENIQWELHDVTL